MKRILVILGPTSVGKTDLGLKLAEKFNGEIVSADSRQVYKDLDIGTGKLPSSKFKDQRSKIKKQKSHWEIDGIKIWMLDVVDPKEQYNVADFVRDATGVIDDVYKRGKLPIIVGGTGHYIKALLEGFETLNVPVNEELRRKLENLPLSVLQEKLKRLSQKKWGAMNSSDRQNPRRLIRALEVLSIYRDNDKIQKSAGKSQKYNTLKIGLAAPREVLYEKSDIRVIERVKQGMINEAEKLYKEGLTIERMKQLGLEYRVLADYLTGQIKTEEELINVIQKKIHGYIRRQITWFKKERNVCWFDIRDKNFSQKVENMVRRWYDQKNAPEN